MFKDEILRLIHHHWIYLKIPCGNPIVFIQILSIILHYLQDVSINSYNWLWLGFWDIN